MSEAIAHARLPFSLLSDVELTAIDAYGVRHRDEPKGRQIARPAIFLLDANGVVRYAYVGEHERDRPAIGTILLGLESIEVEAGDRTQPETSAGDGRR